LHVTKDVGMYENRLSRYTQVYGLPYNMLEQTFLINREDLGSFKSLFN